MHRCCPLKRQTMPKNVSLFGVILTNWNLQKSVSLKTIFKPTRIGKKQVNTLAEDTKNPLMLTIKKANTIDFERIFKKRISSQDVKLPLRYWSICFCVNWLMRKKIKTTCNFYWKRSPLSDDYFRFSSIDCKIFIKEECVNFWTKKSVTSVATRSTRHFWPVKNDRNATKKTDSGIF